MVALNEARLRLGRWSPTVFLVAGALLAVSAAIEALGTLVGVATADGPLLVLVSVAGFGGIVLSFAALVGLSVRLGDHAPRLATVGAGLVVLPTLFACSLFLCVTVVSVLGIPSPTEMLPALGVVTGAMFVLAAVGVTALGVANLRSDAHSRTAAAALFGFAAGWYLLVAAMLGYGHVPDLANLAATGLMAAATLSLGDALRAETSTVVSVNGAPDSAL